MTIPDSLDSDNPAETLEYHIGFLKDIKAIPQDFKLSDNSRKYLVEKITEMWELENAVPIISHTIFGFITGYYLGMMGK